MSFSLKKTNIICDKYNINIYDQETISITVKITDYNNTPIANEEFEVYIDDTLKTSPSTDSNGSSTITYTLANDLGNIGVHTIRVNEAIIRINAYYDTGWNEVSYKTGFGKHSGYSVGTEYRVYNHTVALRGSSTTTSTWNGDEKVFASIPVDYAPVQNHVLGLMQGTGANKWLLAVRKDGDLSVQRYGMSSNATSVASGVWLPIDYMYTI